MKNTIVPMKSWVVYAIISMVFAGLTSVIAKMGLSGISGELGLAIRTCFAFVVVPAQQLATVTRDNLFWLGISGVTTSLSWIFYYKALKDGQVSTIALIDKGSMVIAVVCAYFILKEQITWRTILGGSLMLSGLLVIAKR